jgi:hypothetical protein
MTDRSTLRSSIIFSVMKSKKREAVLQYISTDEQIADILVKPLPKMKSLHTQEISWDSWKQIPYLKRKRLLPGWEGALICY